MGEKLNLSGVEYREFPFETYIADLAATIARLREQDLDDDPDIPVGREDSMVDFAIGRVVEEANSHLAAHGLIGSDVMVMPDRMLLPTSYLHTSSDEQIVVNAGSQSTTDIDPDEPIWGFYQGLYSMQAHMPDVSVDCARTQVYHRVMVQNTSVENPFVEQYTRLYGYIPIEEKDFQLLQPTISQLPNENWLRGIAAAIVNPHKTSPQQKSTGDIFARLYNAPYSKVDVQKRLDWLYDQLTMRVGGLGKVLTIQTNEYQIEAEDNSVTYVWNSAELSGHLLGFTSLPTHQVLEDGSVHIDDTCPRLAIVIEGVTQNNQRCMLTIPFD